MVVGVVFFVASCASEVTLQTASPTPDPTAWPDEDPYGEPPANWSTCAAGYYGRYYNLEVTHPAVEPDDLTLPSGITPEDLDWWDEAFFAFERYDASLDIGVGWWPVDTGLEADPAYFSVHWTAWLRAWSTAPASFSLASQDDAWVVVGGLVVAELPGIHDFEVQTFEWMPERATQYPVDVYFAHRSGMENGFRLVVSGLDVQLCYPEY